MQARITVTAGAGRVTPIDRSIATAPGGGLLLLREGDRIDVPATDHRIVRQLRSGDLVRVEPAKAKG